MDDFISKLTGRIYIYVKSTKIFDFPALILAIIMIFFGLPGRLLGIALAFASMSDSDISIRLKGSSIFKDNNTSSQAQAHNPNAHENEYSEYTVE